MDAQDLLARITADPGICHGKPCIRGLRYSVESILELLSSGMTEQEILEDYDDLERADLQAASAYAEAVRNRDDARWDQEMASDAESGRLNFLFEETDRAREVD